MWARGEEATSAGRLEAEGSEVAPRFCLSLSHLSASVPVFVLRKDGERSHGTPFAWPHPDSACHLRVAVKSVPLSVWIVSWLE